MGHKARAKGWCLYHERLVHPDKFVQKCRTSSGGKRCKYFTFTIPEHLKKRR
jgi:hypothetical protein